MWAGSRLATLIYLPLSCAACLVQGLLSQSATVCSVSLILILPHLFCLLLCRLLKDVNTACLEANDTVKYLKPLRKYLEKMNTMDDFTALMELFKPMFHTMLLIWKHSGYYNTSAKMVTLIRELCNDLIMQACKFVPGMHMVKPEDALLSSTTIAVAAPATAAAFAGLQTSLADIR